MKRFIRKSAAVFLAVMIVCTLPVMAFATVSNTLFVLNSSGYRCTGSGTIEYNRATATFNAVALPGSPVVPDENCPSEVWILAYDTDGDHIGSTSRYGTRTARATYVSDVEMIGRTYNTFKFMGVDLGGYTLRDS